MAKRSVSYHEKNHGPLSCEKEPIHLINSIQNCGYLVVVNTELVIVQVSMNIVDLLPSDNDTDPPNQIPTVSATTSSNAEINPILDSIIGKTLDFLLEPDAVQQISNMIQSFTSSSAYGCETTRSFLVRSKSTFFNDKMSCNVIQSNEFFCLEMEFLPSRNPTTTPTNAFDPAQGIHEDRDIMMFMEEIGRGLRKCWSIEEMASLVCSKIMAETPYDRGMVYRFDHDNCGEVIYEAFRHDAMYECKRDSFLGLRFPAADVPRNARDLFLRNTLRFLYDVNGEDVELYPSMVETSMGGMIYTDLSLCRLRAHSVMHIKYLQNMKVTSTLVIAIIVSRSLWGLYSFHGYREPLVPSSRTRFLCEMATVMSSMVMESLTKMTEQERSLQLEKTMVQLQNTHSIENFLQAYHVSLKATLDLNCIAYRITQPGDGNYSSNTPAPPNDNSGSPEGPPLSEQPLEIIKSYGPTDELNFNKETFDTLYNMYGHVCKDCGAVFIDEQKTNNPVLIENDLNTFAYTHISLTGDENDAGNDGASIELILSRQTIIDHVEWAGDPTKALQPNAKFKLSPRNSFAIYIKDHKKLGKPWSKMCKSMVKRFFDQVEKYHSVQHSRETAVKIVTLKKERNEAIEESKANFDFFAHMAHELRTPFHGLMGCLEAMREDPRTKNNELLKTAELCGKNLIKILDDILLVAKGSYSLEIESKDVDIHEFLKQTLGDMISYAHMEGLSIRIRKEDIFHKAVKGDFNRIRQVLHNLISNAIKFSEDDIYIELCQRKTFPEVLSVWKSYKIIYPNVQPAISELVKFMPHADKSGDTVWIIFSVIDKGIGISPDDLKRLGTPFTQLSAGRQKKYQGTGLGINICNMLVTALNGKLVMYSVPGFGSCLSFALPVKMMAEEECHKAYELTLSRETVSSALDTSCATKEQIIQNLQREYLELTTFMNKNGAIEEKNSLKFLVVDDSKVNRKLCGRKIHKYLPDVEVVECVHGKAALEEYQFDSCNILGIFMDFHMHTMGGEEATKLIRELERIHERATTATESTGRRVYIAGYTADILEDSTQMLLECGMDSILPKPEPDGAFESTLWNMLASFYEEWRTKQNV